MQPITLNTSEARRFALAAQHLHAPPKKNPTQAVVLQTINRLGLLQIDSVNVLARAHYLPLFSRLGSCPQSHLDTLAWGPAPCLFEYWAHEASLLPHSAHPLLRWRMADARAGGQGWKNTAAFMGANHKLLHRALDEIRDRGPLAASELAIGKKGAGGWWGWSDAKRVLECLFAAGDLTSITRRGTFERVYGLPQSLFSADILNTPTPARADAQRALLCIAIRALGVATEPDLRDYFRLRPGDSKALVAQMVEQGDLRPAIVDGWSAPAFIDAKAVSVKKATHQALLSPFDNLIWHRARTERMFGARIRLEIYTPAHMRTHGYYVLPFLEDDAITARVDLKADRKSSTLVVQASHAEPCATTHTASRLAQELAAMAAWLALENIRIEKRGALAKALQAEVRQK